MNKKSIFAFISAFAVLNTGLFAQNIELPEVTTVISGETEKAEEDTLPDFSDVLKLPKGSGNVEPELPEVEASEDTDIASGKTKPVEKTVYAEGYIGGGFPVNFTGNISVARTVGANPFKISFEHDTAQGYARHSVTEGYSDRTTKLSIEKQYKKNHLEWGAAGTYKSASDGLQGKLIYGNSAVGLLNHDLYNAQGDIKYSFDNGFSLGAAADAKLFNRYTDIYCSNVETANFLSISPQLMCRWEGNGFDTGFTTEYDYETELNNDISFHDSHRVKFMLDLQWKNDYVRLYGNAAAVVGYNIMLPAVIVPFTVGVDSSFPVYFSNRRVTISAEGGIDSYKSKTYELEEAYKFTRFNSNTLETSEWYGRFNFNIPLKTTFTGSAGIEYRQTAYGNGRWQPDYTTPASIYGYSIKDFKMLATDFTLAYHQGIFSISGSWHSNWLDVPCNENNHLVKLDVNIQEEDSKWGVDVNCQLPINENIETPIISAEGFVRVTPSVRAVLNISDIIKFYRGETRSYAGKYETRGGSITALLKFVF